MHWLIAFGAWLLIADFLHYICLLPYPDNRPLAPQRLDRYAGACLYGLALLLSIVRLPLVPLPYLTKLFVRLVLGLRYKVEDAPEWHEAVAILGDLLNFALTGAALGWLIGPPRWGEPLTLLYLPLVAETIRLGCEKGRMLSSALWQRLPHRGVARWIGQRRRVGRRERWWLAPFAQYCRYYMLDDDDRLRYVLYALQQRSVNDPELAGRLASLRGFRIVPASHSLRAGRVRDVAAGVVFVHRRWTNDPGLLAGQALRRGPWLFDPRYLRRPFCYRSEANPLMTRCVLHNWRYCPGYAVYQFGHEIKSGRYTLFFGVLRRCGWVVESPVGEDGTHDFDPLLHWFAARLRRADQKGGESRPLWGEEAIHADLRERVARGEHLTVAMIAERYTLPRNYVADVVLGGSAVPSDAQQALGYAAQTTANEPLLPEQRYVTPSQ